MRSTLRAAVSPTRIGWYPHDDGVRTPPLAHASSPCSSHCHVRQLGACQGRVSTTRPMTGPPARMAVGICAACIAPPRWRWNSACYCQKAPTVQYRSSSPHDDTSSSRGMMSRGKPHHIPAGGIALIQNSRLPQGRVKSASAAQQVAGAGQTFAARVCACGLGYSAGYRR